MYIVNHLIEQNQYNIIILYKTKRYTLCIYILIVRYMISYMEVGVSAAWGSDLGGKVEVELLRRLGAAK